MRDTNIPTDERSIFNLHSLTTYVEIRGNNAKFYAGENHSSLPEGTLIHESNCEENNIMAAILYEGYGWADEDHELAAQGVLWYFWDTWLDASIGTDVEFISAGMGWYDALVLPNGNSVDLTHSRGYNLQDLGENVSASHMAQQFNKFVELAKQKLYNVNIYHFADFPNDYTAHQHVILTERLSATERKENIPVTKLWIDADNKYNTRPSSITVELLANDEPTGKTLTLNADNNWKGEFGELERDDSIVYTVKEVSCSGYDITTNGNVNTGFTVTNTLLTKVTVEKEWDDMENVEGIRPSSVTVTLYSNGNATNKTVTLNEENGWRATFEGLYKCDSSGNVITYTVKEDSIEGYEATYTTSEDTSNGNTTIKVKNTHKSSYIELTGKVWEDIPDGKANAINGILEDDEPGLGGIKVILKDKDGNQFDATSTAITKDDGTYTIKVYYDNSEDVTNKLDTAYVEFEYDGLKYTTVKPSVSQGGSGNLVPSSQQSKAIELYDEDENKNGNETQTNKVSVFDSTATWRWEYEKGEYGLFVPSNADKFESLPLIVWLHGMDNAMEGTESGLLKSKGPTTFKNWNKKGFNAYIVCPQTTANMAWCYPNAGKIEKIIETMIEKYNIDTNNIVIAGHSAGAVGSLTMAVNYPQYFSKVVSMAGYSDVEKAATIPTKCYVGEKDIAFVQYMTDNLKPLYGADNCFKMEGADHNSVVSEVFYEDNGKHLGTAGNGQSDLVEWMFEGVELTEKTAKGETTKVSTISSTKQTEGKTRKNLDDTYSKITSTTDLNKLTDADKNVIATTQSVITSFDTYKTIEGNSKGNIIKNVNLGLFKREQPDLSIESNISEVEVIENGEKFTYKYNSIVTDDTNEDVKAQFQNKQSYTYRRPVNPSNITYLKETTNQEAMSVYVTYEVTVTNKATTLTSTVHNIINCYDNRYILESATINGNAIKYNNSSIYGQSETDFSEVTLSGLDIKLNPNEKSSKILLRYRVTTDAIIGLLNEDATLSNSVEIESYSTNYGKNTLYAEQEKGGRTDKPYAGYDTSHPGNAGIKLQEVNYSYTYTDSNENKQTKTYTNVKVLKSTENLVDYKLSDGTIIKDMPEDDTDIAPSFLLCKETEPEVEEQPKTLSGTVFVDTDITENAERLGDGKYGLDANGNQEKTIENVKVELYNIDGTLATLYDESGNVIENAAVQYTDTQGSYKFERIEEGKQYYLKFTYGNEDASKPTKINGEVEINARNYKSTIITSPILKGIIDKKYEDFTEEDKNWLINIEDNYSVAVDNLEERVRIDDLQYSNFDKPLNMTACTKPFKAEQGTEKLDFGIIERPRENLVVEKTITYLKLKLANGQVLTEGDPRTQSLAYAKTMGFNQNVLEKQVLIELDTELIQGAELEVQYLVKVTNNNEIDYDYGVDKTSYYYYGNKNGLSMIEATIELADYLNEELTYRQSTNSWENIEADAIHIENNEQISDETWTDLKSNKYKIYKTSVTLAREQSYEQQFLTTKVLSNNEENVFDNNVEIIKIDGKTARTIKEVGVEKTYKPGNYLPTLSDAKEQDDDRVRIIITPPTGIITYIIYIVTTVTGLVIISLGVIFIKKKVLIK